jgi:hypothetical protein
LITVALIALPGRVRAAETDRADTPPEQVPLPTRTLAAVPAGVDAFSAFVEGSAVGATAVGSLDGRSEGDGRSRASAGSRLWVTLGNRVVAQAEAGNDASGRFVPSLTAVVRVLGDRQTGWAAAALARYRTEGFSTLEGEAEAGLLGSYARHQLHLDLGLIAGVGLEEEEADGEAVFRFGYDLVPSLRLGAEARVRRELLERPRTMPAAAEGDEWDAFAGIQGTLALGQFFGCLTLGPQKVRSSEELGWMAQLSLGGVAF